MIRGLSRNDIIKSIKNSKEWLENLYGRNISSNRKWKDFNIDKIHFSKTSTRYHFSRNGIKGSDKIVWMGLRDIDMWYGYCRKTKLGFHPPISGVKLHCKKLGFERKLVHELTHMIQYLQGRKSSEVETSENETLYVLEKEPFYFSHLIGYEEKKRQEKDSNLWGYRNKPTRKIQKKLIQDMVDSTIQGLEVKYRNV